LNQTYLKYRYEFKKALKNHNCDITLKYKCIAVKSNRKEYILVDIADYGEYFFIWSYLRARKLKKMHKCSRTHIMKVSVLMSQKDVNSSHNEEHKDVILM